MHLSASPKAPGSIQARSHTGVMDSDEAFHASYSWSGPQLLKAVSA